MKKRCELCRFGASIYCESDQASLCWDCDSKVHSANFLVARHSRTLLCHVCGCPTAWTASGSKLGRTVSVCQRRHGGGDTAEVEERVEENDCDKIGSEDDDEDSEEEEDDDDEEEEGDGDNQVVPLTWPPPPPASSSSSSGDDESSSSSSRGLKRFRDRCADFCSNDDLGCLSTYRNTISKSASAEAGREKGPVSVDSFHHLKRKWTRIEPIHTLQCGPPSSRNTTSLVIGSLKRFYEQGRDKSTVVIAGIRELSEKPATVGSDSMQSPP